MDDQIKDILGLIFQLLDVKLFNNLLKRPDLYTSGCGFQIKMAVSQVESAYQKLDKKHTGAIKINFLKEACNLLIIDRHSLEEEENLKSAINILNATQVKHILLQMKPDEVSPKPISPQVQQAIEKYCERLLSSSDPAIYPDNESLIKKVLLSLFK